MLSALLLAVPFSSAVGAAPTATPIGWAPGAYVPLQTVRLLDTPTGLGAPKRPVAAQGVIAMQVTGRGAVPQSGVGSVVLNVTAHSAATAGAVTVYPHGGRRPGFGQLRFAAVVPRASLVTVPVGAGGAVDLYNGSTGSVQLVADVVGYYVAGTPEAKGMFHPVAPVKVYDTTTALGTQGVTGPVTERSGVVMALGGRPPVPNEGVAALVLNVTAKGATGVGSLVVHGGEKRPGAISLRYPAVTAVTQQMIVPMGPYGQVFISNQSMTKVHVAVEVVGWYATPRLLDDMSAVDVTGSTRSLDPVVMYRSTATSPDPAGVTRTVKVLGRGGVPDTGVSAVHVVLTGVSATASGALAAFPAGGRAPGASNLYFRPGTGAGASNSAIVPVGADGSISVLNRSAGSTQIQVAVDGYVLQRTVSVRPVGTIAATNDQIQQVDCVTSTFCIALDRFGNAARFDGTTWGAPVSTGVVEGRLSCASTSFCMVVGGGSYNVFNGAAWSSSRAAPLGATFNDVDCAAPSHCVALTNGSARSFDAGVWGAPTTLFPSASEIECVGAAWCMAIGSGTTYARMINGTWGTASVGATTFVGVLSMSCGASTSCMVVSGNSLWRFDGSAWSPPSVFASGFRILQSVSCTGLSSCALLDDQQVISFDGGVQGVSAGTPALNPRAVSCVSATWCMVVARWDWAAPLVDGVFGDVSPVLSRGASRGVSCPTSSWCMAVSDSFARRYVAPNWGSFEALPPLPLPRIVGYDAVSCSSPTFCLAVGDNGGSALWDGTTWTPHEETGYTVYSSVSCPVDGFCVAGTGGFYSVYDHGTWTRATLGANFGSDVTDCVSAAWCRLLTKSGQGFAWDGSSFVASTSPGFAATGLECLTTTWCMAVGGASGVGQAALFDGATWTVSSIPLVPSSLSCVSAVACVAVDDVGNLASFDGSAWQLQSLGKNAVFDTIFRVACLERGRCLVTEG